VAISSGLTVYACENIKLEINDHPWDPQKSVQNMIIGQRFGAHFFVLFSWVGDLGWSLLTGTCCLKVVIDRRWTLFAGGV
jgi:hypothetical protein